MFIMSASFHHALLLCAILVNFLSTVAGDCSCGSSKDVSPKPTVFASLNLPENPCCMPSVGNGYLATVVFSDSIHVNSVYNGRLGDSHRAKIPSTADIQVDTTCIKTINESYALEVDLGVFSHRMSSAEVELEHRVYAHQVLSRLVVNEITVSRNQGSESPIRVDLIYKFDPKSKDVHLTTVPPATGESTWFAFGDTTTAETNTSATSNIYLYWTDVPKNIVLSPGEDSRSWAFVTSVSESKAEALESYNLGLTLWKKGALFSGHAEAWTDKWSRGRIDVAGNLYLAKAIYGSMYYILSSLPPLTAHKTFPFQFYGINPGALAHGGSDPDGYRGHIFWDQETWMYPPIMVFHPELALAMLGTRTHHLQAAKDNAQKNGHKGAQYPWEMAYTGVEVCPADPYPTNEIHISGDIAFAVQQYLWATNDTDFLLNRAGFDMIVSIAEFWASKVDYNESLNLYTINNVMPPDEYQDKINNSVYTNTIAQISLRLPAYAASLINKTVPNEWARIADEMYIPYDQTLQYHPEFQGYLPGTVVKQADAIMLGYPLMKNMTSATRRNDLQFYETYNGTAVTDPDGPAMTWGMFAIGWLELKNLSKAETLFDKSYANIQQPYKIWTETATGEGAINFVTGMGGFLQAVIFGYGGMRLQEDGLHFDITLPPKSQNITLSGVDYFGNSLDISATDGTVTVVLTDSSQNHGEGVQLELIQGTDVYPLAVGTPVAVSRDAFIIVPR